MQKLFEVPYNFDEPLIKFYKKHAHRINYLYIPPYKNDLFNTRSSIQTNVKGHCYMPQTREEYESHLCEIKHSGLRFVILWQDSNSLISRSQLDYYSKLGTSGFIIANDINAKRIKDYNPALIVICSLVQRVQTDILKRDFSDYDFIILYYTFNRSLDAIKKLVKLKDKIILMPNTLCNIECPSVHHWFPSAKKPFDFHNDCWLRLDTLKYCGLIFPEHLYLFNEHVAGYKLQGREFPTEAIKYLCHFYFKEEYYDDFISPFLREDMMLKLCNLVNSMNVDDYYNIYTKKIIDCI